MPLPPTPWLNPPDYIGSYLKGTALGSEAAQARNRLVAAQQQAQNEIAVARERIQQQAVEAQMEAMIRRETAEREARVQQSRIDIDSAYKQAQLGLAQQRAEEIARMNDLKISEAARKFQAGQDYEAEVNRLMSEEGKDQAQASIEASFKYASGLGITGGGIAQMARAQQATIPRELEVKETEGGRFYRSSPTEQYKYMAPGADLESASVRSAFTRIGHLQDYINQYSPGKKEREATEAEILSLKESVNESFRRQNKPVPYPNIDEWKGATQIGGFRILRAD